MRLKRSEVAIFSAILAGLIGYIVYDSSKPTKQDNNALPAESALDYSKPIFTKCCTVVCPEILLLAKDTNHSPERITEMFSSVAEVRSNRAKQLGCVELQEGIPLYDASRLMDKFASVHLSNDNVGYFTPEDELTNAVPGQSSSEAAELAKVHIYREASVPIPIPDDNSPGSLLLRTPSRGPIPKGNVVAAGDITGYGAAICPDPNTFIALMNAILKESEGRYQPSHVGISRKPISSSELRSNTSRMASDGTPQSL